MSEDKALGEKSMHRLRDAMARVTGKCNYDGLPPSLEYPSCKDAPTTHVVKFAEGASLNLCGVHADWYISVHPKGFKLPMKKIG